MVKVLIVFHSAYGHILSLAQKYVEGVKKAGGEPILRRVNENLPEEVLTKMGAIHLYNKIKDDIPVVTTEEVASADAIILGAGTRFGSMPGQMKSFLDTLSSLWLSGALVGKPAGCFTSSATQHGGQESTILGMHVPLLHLGCVIVGCPYSFQAQMGNDEIHGVSPYGVSTIANGDGSRQPSQVDLDAAVFHGEHIAKITTKLSA